MPNSYCSLNDIYVNRDGKVSKADFIILEGILLFVSETSGFLVYKCNLTLTSFRNSGRTSFKNQGLLFIQLKLRGEGCGRGK